jgi:hypothetical protein
MSVLSLLGNEMVVCFISVLQSPVSFPVPTIFGRRFGFGGLSPAGSPFGNKCEQVAAAAVLGLTSRQPRWSCGLVVDGSSDCAAGGKIGWYMLTICFFSTCSLFPKAFCYRHIMKCNSSRRFQGEILG